MVTLAQKTLPSARWTSAEGWDYNGMKERIEELLTKLDKSALVRHAAALLGREFTLSEPFSAGQYWICFELVAQDPQSIVIARVRLPKHPDTPDALDEQSELNSIQCEVATMQYIRDRLPSVPVPQVYAYAGPSSKHAEDAGAMYMLIEGFCGNRLEHDEWDMTTLPLQTQEHIISQWTAAQVAVASLKFPVIGSIHAPSSTADPELGPLTSAALEGLENAGPFLDSQSYFKEVAKARYARACQAGASLSTKVVILTFMDVVDNTVLFTSNADEEFSLSHMDMGEQNILMDDSFNLVAVIDWEFAQTAPWQVTHYPMPFPLTHSDARIEAILRDPGHIAYHNVSRQDAARKLYKDKMKQAEEAMTRNGHRVTRSIADSLNGPESRIYACLERVSEDDEYNEALACEMVRLAFGLDLEAAKKYLVTIKARLDLGGESDQ